MIFVLRGEIPSKKNSKGMVLIKGIPRLFPSSRYQKWRREAVKQITWREFPIKACKVHITFYPGSKRRADLTNKAESIMDLLVEKEVIEDDNYFVVKELTLVFAGIDKSNPRAIVIVNPE